MARPRKSLAHRTASGRIVRSQQTPKEQPADEVVVRFRQRAYGASEKTARDPRFGYELGRLSLAARIEPREHDAGLKWAQNTARYARTMGYPAPTPKAVRLGASLGRTPDEPSENTIRRLAESHMKAQTALAAAGPYALRACREVCILDLDTGQWGEETIAALKAGLAALADLYELR